MVRQNYMLNGSMFSKIFNQTFDSCKYHCIGSHSCKSFNVENKEPGECQLNSETIGIGNKTAWLIRTFGWTFSSTSYIETNVCLSLLSILENRDPLLFHSKVSLQTIT